MQPTIIQVNDVDLCIQAFGNDDNPTLLLIMGAAASMDWWPDAFCSRLAAASRHVVRYDLRDTGQSTNDEPGAPSYTSTDLVGDALGILDVQRIERAHLVGMSMGGGIAQHLAATHPDRVASLTLISSTPVDSERSNLPPMSEELQRAFDQPSAEPDWSDREAVIDYIVSGTVPMLGSLHTDESVLRDLVGRVFDRTQDMASTNTNHWILDDGDLGEPDLGQLTMPTLVIHGTEDPLFPFEHGRALSQAISGARLVPLEGVGHADLPPATWDTVVDAIINVTDHA